MLKNLRIIYIIITARLGPEFNSRVNYLFEQIGSLIFFFLHLVSFSLILGKFRFPGWATGEIWVLLFTFEIFTYLAFFLLWRGLNQTVKDINSGAFDFILTKPASPRLLAFVRSGGLHNLVAAFLGLVSLVVVLIKYHLSVSSAGVIVYGISLIAGLWFLHCFSILFVSLNFIYGYIPGTAGAVFSIQESYKYPATVYEKQSVFARFFILPLALLTTFPAANLLLKPLHFSLICIYIISLIAVSVISRLIWSSALRHYSSASS